MNVVNVAVFSPADSVSPIIGELGTSNVDFFETFREFRLALCLKQYDWAICMQDGDRGWQSVVTIRQKFPEIPILYISDTDKYAYPSYLAHVAMFLTKPFTADGLKNAIAKIPKWQQTHQSSLLSRW